MVGRRANREGVAYTMVDPTEELALKRVIERLPEGGNRKRCPARRGSDETAMGSEQMARTLDFVAQADPTYQGAFHEKETQV